MQQCLWCGREVPPKSKNKHGRQPRLCSIECKRSHLKRYIKEWQRLNVESVARRRDANRDQFRQWGRDFYARHRDRRKAQRLERYHCNAESEQAAQKAYQQANPDKIRAIGRRSALSRRARLKDAFVEQVDPQTVFDRDKGICGLCNGAIDPASDWHVDHVVPLVQGGPHSYANVQAAHGRCNRAKGGRIWPQSQSRSSSP